MDKEKIKLENNFYEIDGIKNNENLLEICFSDNVDIESLSEDTNKFNKIELLTRGDTVYGCYENYNTVYLIKDNTITLSNDGSVYKEPDPIINPDPQEPYIPTVQEVQKAKIAQMSYTCEQMIIAGIDLEINGEIQHFSYKLEDQNDIKDAFELAVQTGLSVPYHADGELCALYTVEQITKLYVSEKTNLTHHKTYFNQLRAYIESLDDTEIISAINYGDELTGEYLDNYNMIMDHSKLIIVKTLEGGTV